jgi:hypothetical protein
MRSAAVIATIALATSIVVGTPVAAQADTTALLTAGQFGTNPLNQHCADALVLGARGSGELDGLGNTVGPAVDKLAEQLGSQRIVRYATVDYTSAAVSVIATDILQSATLGGSDWNYFASVDDGTAKITQILNDSKARCPNEKWLLLGYSQGALALHRALANGFSTETARVKGVYLIADPARVAGELPSGGTAVAGNGITTAMKIYSPPYPTALSSVTVSYCNKDDLVCDYSNWLDQASSFDNDTVLAAANIHGTQYQDGSPGTYPQGVDRVLAATVPIRNTFSKVACSPSAHFSGSVANQFAASGRLKSGAWSVTPGGFIDGAATTSDGFRLPDGHEFIMGSDGSFAGTLPVGDIHVPLTFSWLPVGGLSPAPSDVLHATLLVHVDDFACGALSGTLTGAYSGVSVDNIHVQATDATTGTIVGNATTDDTGAWSIFGLHAGAVLVRFGDGDGGIWDQYYTGSAPSVYARSSGDTVAIPGDGTIVPLDQTVTNSSTLTASFVDARTFAPLSGMELFVPDAGPDVISDVDGQATLPEVFPHLPVCAYVSPVSRTVNYVPWAGYSYTMSPTFRIREGATVSGRIVDQNGAPQVGVSVYLHRQSRSFVLTNCYQDYDGLDSAVTTTDADGNYRFDRLYGGPDIYIWAGDPLATPDFTNPITAAPNGGSATGINFTHTSAGVSLPFGAAPVPKITGGVVPGSKLTASLGKWVPSGADFTYQWMRNDGAIDGATNSQYTVAPEDAGNKVAVRVTANLSGYDSTVRTSATVNILLALTATPTPTIRGTARVGKLLTARVGTWAPASVVLSYAWSRNGVPISRAHHATYRLTSRDRGKKITVSVTGKAPGYQSVTRTSNRVIAR